MKPRGVLVATEPFASTELVALAQRIEGLGYESLWLPELLGREPFATAGFLLGHTSRLALGTAIANVYVRDANAMAQARQSLAELSGGRFMLGLGVSNAAFNQARGHGWQAPLTKMSAYFDTLSAARIDSPAGPRAPTYLAAHGPALQSLAATRADGIVTYLMPPEHTARARARIGATPALNAVAFFLAEPDPAVARRKARAALALYVRLDYYHREWRRLGFADADFADGGSDRLIDALVAWGDATALHARIAAYERAGASRVIVLPLGLRTRQGLDPRVLELLAPAG